MKKTILFLEQQSWKSGAQQVLEAVLDALSGQFDSIVAFPDFGPFRKSLDERKIETITFPLGSYRTGEKSFAEKLNFAGRSIVSAFELASIIRKRGVELVYINGPRCLPAGVVAARLTSRPSVFHVHLTLIRKQEILLAGYLGSFASILLACSEATAKPLLKANPRLLQKTRVLYNPVCNRTTAGRAQGVSPRTAEETSLITIGMVGRITPPKGQMILLNALGGLPPDLKRGIKIVFVGEPAPGNRDDLVYVRRLKDRARQCYLGEKIIWAGYHSNPWSFFRPTDLLVHPCLAEAGEGMSMVLLEALQNGIPVIASRTGGTPEIIRDGDNGLLVPPGNEILLSEAIGRFLVDSALRARLQLGARAGLDDRFSGEKFKATIQEIIWNLHEPCSLKKTQPSPAKLTALK